MMRYPRIAILMTCHNRRNLTLDCLERVFAQKGITGMHLEVFLVDDGSGDGTGSAVRQKFPQVTVLEGDGSLYWVGGMRLAYGTALKKDFDFYVWLNDDTRLYDNAFKCLLDTFFDLSISSGHPAVVVGSVCDEKTGKLTYGGLLTQSLWRQTHYKMIEPSGGLRRCDLFHGNCVLIPKEIAMTVGNISSDYRHGSGDFDYALKVKSAGFGSWICPAYVGTCNENKMLFHWKKLDLPMQERVKALNQPIVVARVHDWVTFMKNHYKFLWPYFYIVYLVRLKLPKLYILLKTNFD